MTVWEEVLDLDANLGNDMVMSMAGEQLEWLRVSSFLSNVFYQTPCPTTQSICSVITRLRKLVIRGLRLYRLNLISAHTCVGKPLRIVTVLALHLGESCSRLT